MQQPEIITLQSVPDMERGLLCVAETGNHIPFAVKRFFTMNDMAAGSMRGNHAHRAQSQYFCCMHGAFDICVDGAGGTKNYILDKPSIALNVPPLHWVTITSIRAGSTMLCCASDMYDKSDYICDRAAFEALIINP